MKETDMIDEQTHTYHTFAYFAGDAQIRIDVWYYPEKRITINILHVDKNSAVAQLCRKDISNIYFSDNREKIEEYVVNLAEESLRDLLKALPVNRRNLNDKKVLSKDVWLGSMGFNFAIFDCADVWQMSCFAGNTDNTLELNADVMVINEVISKHKCATKELAMNELLTRFKIECLGMLSDFEIANMIG